MENSETKNTTEAVSQQAYSQKALQDAMTKLCKLQSYLDAIVFITDGECDKTGYTLCVLASESATLCAAAHEMLDIMELRGCKENHLSVQTYLEIDT